MSDTVEKLLDVVQNFKSKEKNNESKSGGRIATIIFGLIAVLAVAITAWRQWKTGKRIAELEHEKAVAEEQEHQAEVDLELAELEEDILEAKQRRDKAFFRANQHRIAIEDLQKERAEAKAAIEKITSWEDVDAFIR